MKILILVHMVPFPPNTGALQRNYNIFKNLAKDNEVHIIAINQPALMGGEKNLEAAKKHLSSFFKSVTVFEMPYAKNKLLWGLMHLLNIFSKWPYSSWRFHNKDASKFLTNFLSNNKIDLVHVDTEALLIYKSCIDDNIPIILNHHNVESKLLYRRISSIKNPLMKWYYKHQANKMKSLERRYLDKINLNICVSEQDKTDLLEISSSSRVEVISNGTDINYFTPLGSEQKEELVFVGSLTWRPNEDGLIYFCKEVMPLILDKSPQTVLNIIGKGAGKELSEAAESNKNINLLGFVDDIRPYVDRAKVYVVPLLVGGGTRLKILDAMAMGKAIVSTQIGAEGLDVKEEIILKDKNQDIAEAILMLLSDDEKRKNLGVAAREKVSKTYSWNIITEKYNELLKNITQP